MFKEVVVTFTSIPQQYREELSELVIQMRGIVSDHLEVGKVTHLVSSTCNTKSDKYNAARINGIPVLQPAWIEEAWKALQENRDDYDPTNSDIIERYKTPLFAGCEITLSGFNGEERAELGDLITSYGGKYTSTMSKSTITHLVIAKNSGQKFEKALQWGTVPIVGPNWLYKSIEMGYRMPEEEYSYLTDSYNITSNTLHCKTEDESDFTMKTVENDSQSRIVSETDTENESKREETDENNSTLVEHQPAIEGDKTEPYFGKTYVLENPRGDNQTLFDMQHSEVKALEGEEMNVTEHVSFKTAKDDTDEHEHSKIDQSVVSQTKMEKDRTNEGDQADNEQSTENFEPSNVEENNATEGTTVDEQLALCDDLGKLLLEGKVSDFTIEMADGSKFLVHKTILAARCQYFMELFENNDQESKDRILVDNIPSKVMREFLDFVYTGKLDSLNGTVGLWKAAEVYKLERLKTICKRSFSKILTIESACDLLILADSYGAEELKMKAIRFIKRNRMEVVRAPGWEQLIDTNKRLITEIFIHDTMLCDTAIFM